MTYSMKTTLAAEGMTATIGEQMGRATIGFAAGQVLVLESDIADPTITALYESLIEDAFPRSTAAPQEVWTLTATSPTTFSVSGSISGTVGGFQNSLAATECTIDVLYSNEFVQFTIKSADVAYQVGDKFQLSVTNGLRSCYLANYFGVGTGDFSRLESLGAAETFTLTAIDNLSFTVTGSVSGAMPNATVGTLYDYSFNPAITQIRFLIEDGLTDFVAGDRYTIIADYNELPEADRWEVQRGASTPQFWNAYLKGQGIVGVGPAFVRIQGSGTRMYGAIFRDWVADAPTSETGGYTKTSALATTLALRVTRRNIIGSWTTAGNSYGDNFYLGLIMSFLEPGVNPYPAYVGICTTNLGVGHEYPITDDNVTCGFTNRVDGQDRRTLYYGTTASTTPSVFPEVVTSNVAVDPSPDVVQKTFVGTGNGFLHGFRRTLNSTAYEVVTLTATSPTTFSVSGASSGALPDATVDVPYKSATNGWAFTIEAGTIAFEVGDEFTADPERLTALTPIELRGWGMLEGAYKVNNTEVEPGDTVLAGGIGHFVSCNLNKDRPLCQSKFAMRMD
mgnify:CR=1 FL=1|tara:strand:- start:2035 stop:3723 length:1689 start_codon:yes stop_codon:yes gene_type:complete